MAKLSAIASIQCALTLLVISTAGPTLAQSTADIVRIGGSPQEWRDSQSYWNRLIDLSNQAVQDSPVRNVSRVENTQAEVEKIIKNLKIEDLFLEPIIKLNGSSQVFGALTNRNKRPVTVTGINFEILDEDGYLIQTGSAQPEPSTLAPGQTVTFSRVLLTVPPDAGYEVKLSEPIFVIAPEPLTPSERTALP
ncbi:MAG: FxLYD domain-containing protein [Thermosynechococcaceae cyanobacterium]